VLEALVPDNVHLTNLTPSVGAEGGVTLNLGVRARSIGDVKQFLESIEKSPLFEKVVVSEKETRDPLVATDIDVTMTAIYYPQRDS